MKLKTLKAKVIKFEKTLKELEEGRKKLTQKQNKFLMSIYPEYPDISFDKLSVVKHQIERTIIKNIRKLKNLELLKSKEVVIEHNLTELFDFNDPDTLTKVLDKIKSINREQEEEKLRQEMLSFTDGLPTQTLEDQEGYHTFENKDLAESFFYDLDADSFILGADSYNHIIKRYCFINNVFFEVIVVAAVYSSKQVPGCSRFYYFEAVDEVSFNHIDFEQYRLEKEQRLEEEKAKKIKEYETKLKELKGL